MTNGFLPLSLPQRSQLATQFKRFSSVISSQNSTRASILFRIDIWGSYH